MVSADMRRAAWSALLLAALADALLVPFYPQFFAQTFGASSLVTPGLYIALCRLAITLTLPAWTYMTRRIAPLRLVAMAQVIAGSAGLLCAVAPNLHVFLALTFVAEGARAAYLLLYPVLFESAPQSERSSTVARVAALMNGAALLSAIAGGFLIENIGGRTALLIVAIADFAQLVCLLRVLPKTRAPVPVSAPSVSDQPAATSRPAVPVTLYMLCALTFCATCAIVLIRPHFTTFLDVTLAPGTALWLLGAIFVVPNAVAVLATPLGVRIAHTRHARLWLIGACWMLAITVLAQFVSPSIAILVAMRALHGLAIYLIDVTVDYAVLCGDGDRYGQFGMVSTVQNAAIVVAPLAAGVLADVYPWQVLFGTAFVVAVAAALSSMMLHGAASRTRAAQPIPSVNP